MKGQGVCALLEGFHDFLPQSWILAVSTWQPPSNVNGLEFCTYHFGKVLRVKKDSEQVRGDQHQRTLCIINLSENLKPIFKVSMQEKFQQLHVYFSFRNNFLNTRPLLESQKFDEKQKIYTVIPCPDPEIPLPFLFT